MLLEMFIAQACIGFTGQQLTACANAIRAASIQMNVAQNVDLLERRVGDLALEKAKTVVGDEILGVAGFTLKVVRDKSVTYPIKRNPDGIIPSVVPTVGVGSGTINLGWRF